MCRTELLAHEALPVLLPVAQHALSGLLSQPASSLGSLQRAIVGEQDVQLLLGVLELLAADVSDVSSPGSRPVWQTLIAIPCPSASLVDCRIHQQAELRT